MGVYLVRTFLFTTPRVLLALKVMLSMWVFHFRSLAIEISTYLADFTFFRACQWRNNQFRSENVYLLLLTPQI